MPRSKRTVAGSGVRLVLDTNTALSGLLWGGTPRHQVLATALAAQADLIVSGDAHLLDLKTFQGIHIVTAASAVRYIGTAP